MPAELPDVPMTRAEAARCPCWPSSSRSRRAARKPLAPWPTSRTSPGRGKPDPILVADGVLRRFGGLTAVDVGHVEIQRGSITALIGPNGAGKTTFFNLLTGFDRPDRGSWTFNGKSLAGVTGVQGGPRRHGPHLPAHQGAVQADGHREHAPRRHRPAWRERVAGPVPRLLAQPGGRHHRARRGAARAVQARRQARRLRRLPLRRPAQAARDGPRAHGRARDGDARRADGRREPGADPVAARATSRTCASRA